jgi:hypothetical protein
MAKYITIRGELNMRRAPTGAVDVAGNLGGGHPAACGGIESVVV